MNIKQFIEFLQTLPQDAMVCVLSHYSEHSVYLQGGSCKVEEFNIKCKEYLKGDKWTYGEHYEITPDTSGQMYLQLGVMDK